MKRIIGIVAVLAALWAAPASAVVLGLDWGVIGSSAYSIFLNGSYLGTDVLAGNFNAYLGGTLGNPLPPSDGSYIGQTYCVNLGQLISIPTEYEVADLRTGAMANGERVAWLYNNLHGGVGSDPDKAAGLQLAIWNTIYDTDASVGSGSFAAFGGSALAAGHADHYLELLDGVDASGSQARFLQASGDGQDMVGPVPEPGSVLLLGLGLGVVGVTVARRRRI